MSDHSASAKAVKPAIQRADLPQYIDEKQLEAMTGISRRTWQQARLLSKGPRYYKPLGKSVRYLLDEVNAWIASTAVDAGSLPLNLAHRRMLTGLA